MSKTEGPRYLRHPPGDRVHQSTHTGPQVGGARPAHGVETKYRPNVKMP